MPLFRTACLSDENMNAQKNSLPQNRRFARENMQNSLFNNWHAIRMSDTVNLQGFEYRHSNWRAASGCQTAGAVFTNGLCRRSLLSGVFHVKTPVWIVFCLKVFSACGFCESFAKRVRRLKRKCFPIRIWESRAKNISSQAIRLYEAFR